MIVRSLVAAALLSVAFFGLPKLPTPRPAAVVSVVEPSEEMKNAVQPVVKVVSSMSAIDRLWLQGIYLNCARLVAADGIVGEQVVTTTEGLRAVHIAVLKFIWKGLAGNDPNKYPDLSEAIDESLNSVVSDKSQQLTPELRKKAVDLFTAIAWAGLGKDG